jgi:hypothetical protein
VEPENWCNPNTGEWERTFAVITVPSNELVGQIHNRMPAILKPETYDRWLGLEPDPYELLITYPSEPMTMWPISTRVNKPENDDPVILDRMAEPVDWQAPLAADGCQLLLGKGDSAAALSGNLDELPAWACNVALV